MGYVKKCGNTPVACRANTVLVTKNIPSVADKWPVLFKWISNRQDAVINELKHKTRLVQEKKLLQQDEVYNGALEDILLGLKSEPYRRADAVRRSQRRRIDNNRLSKTMEEMDF